MEAQLEEELSQRAKRSCADDVMEVFCPCCVKAEVKFSPKCKVVLPEKKTEKGTEASGKLLETTRDPDSDPDPEVVETTLTSDSISASPGAIYRARPSPSAPVLDDSRGSEVEFSEDYQAAAHRKLSQPVQATT